MLKNPEIDSALHILKGAAEKILGSVLTTGVYSEGTKGRLTVEFDRKPDDAEMHEIEQKANEKISENVPIEVFEIARKDAEEKFGNVIYDKFPVPLHITPLRIVRIKDWNINCCIGEHLKSTGELKRIKILKYRFRPSRKELEISFEAY
jgi:alanyl-tRNA synthetase